MVDAIGVGSCAMLTLIAFSTVVQPIMRTQSRRASMQTELAVQHDQVTKLNASHTRLERQLSVVQQRLANSQIRLQAPDHLNARMALIVDLAATANLVLHETTSGAMKSGLRYLTFPINLSGTGTYSTCAAFLHQLHESLPDIGVVEFELSGNPSNPTAPAAFSFDLDWYAAPTLSAAHE